MLPTPANDGVNADLLALIPPHALRVVEAGCSVGALAREYRAANPDSERGMTEFEQLIGEHVGFSLNNAARALFLGLTGGRLAKAPPGPVRRYGMRISGLRSAMVQSRSNLTARSISSWLPEIPCLRLSC